MSGFHKSSVISGHFGAMALAIWAGLTPLAHAATVNRVSERAAPPKYVAIAASASVFTFGFEWNASSQSEAAQSAIAHCNRDGRADCRLLATGRSECIALGISPSEKVSIVAKSPFQDVFSDLGVHPELAEVQARAKCKEAGGKSCETMTVCSDWPSSRHPELSFPSEKAAAEPARIDPNIVGTWELALASGPWVLEVLGNGTYKFHSEAQDGVASNAGTFSTAKGHWSLKASTGYTDGGTYSVQSHDVWIATSQWWPGTGTWRRRS